MMQGSAWQLEALDKWQLLLFILSKNIHDKNQFCAFLGTRVPGTHRHVSRGSQRSPGRGAQDEEPESWLTTSYRAALGIVGKVRGAARDPWNRAEKRKQCLARGAALNASPR